MGMNSSNLDRKIQFRRFASVPDGGGGVTEEWADHGAPVWAHRADVSDSEKFTAGLLQATLLSRFTVRSSAFSRDINPKDGLCHAGIFFEITGAKESRDGRLQYIEFTCQARVN